MERKKLSPFAQGIVTDLEKCSNKKDSEILVDMMPLTGKAASRHYTEAVRYMYEHKGDAYTAWMNNSVKFIVDQSKV